MVCTLSPTPVGTFTEIEPNDGPPPNPPYQDLGTLGSGDWVVTGFLSSVSNDGSVPTGESDYFRFTVGVTGVWWVTLDCYTDGGNDYDLVIYDATGAYLTDSSFSDPVEQLTGNVNNGETYFIRVIGWSGAPGSYRLTLQAP